MNEIQAESIRAKKDRDSRSMRPNDQCEDVLVLVKLVSRLIDFLKSENDRDCNHRSNNEDQRCEIIETCEELLNK